MARKERSNLLRQHREEFELTLEEVGEKLRDIAERHRLNVAANFQTIWSHENGTHPNPHYRRAYCILYRRNEAELGLRPALPGEEPAVNEVATMEREPSLPEPSQAILRALGSIDAGTNDVNAEALRERIVNAWRFRTSGGSAGDPTVVLVGGFAGSGKSEFAKFLGNLTGWTILDKDTLTRQLVDQLLIALGGEAHDRSSTLYREKVRPLEYRCLIEVARENINSGISVILDAPFISEFSQADWMQRLNNFCRAKRASLATIWVDCDPESMREYIEFRGAARDMWKMEAWDEYLSTLDLKMRPQGPHFVVNNRLGAAVTLVDEARDVLSGGGL
ncbi:AAA family ATPase [Streptomyces sp. PR69]|uniref:AAA family ATPase n=1 Tax=Streptomyces sp. PR69 TaxID=2984950 RepID=UPI0022652C40|nr:ATP-binding protein [Streptomyces sp. PR69]